MDPEKNQVVQVNLLISKEDPKGAGTCRVGARDRRGRLEGSGRARGGVVMVGRGGGNIRSGRGRR